MEKFMYHGHDITESIARKEKKIIELYSQKKQISFETAEKIYFNSTLLDVMRDVENDLWTQSEQYIVHAYFDALDEVNLEEKSGDDRVDIIFDPDRQPTAAWKTIPFNVTNSLGFKTGMQAQFHVYADMCSSMADFEKLFSCDDKTFESMYGLQRFRGIPSDFPHDIIATISSPSGDETIAIKRTNQNINIEGKMSHKKTGIEVFNDVKLKK